MLAFHKKFVFGFFLRERAGLLRLQKCEVTDAKVMTFTASKYVYNLPQTSIVLGKLTT